MTATSARVPITAWLKRGARAVDDRCFAIRVGGSIHASEGSRGAPVRAVTAGLARYPGTHRSLHSRRRTLVLGVLVLLIAAFGAAAAYYFYESAPGRSPARRRTSSSPRTTLPTEPSATTTQPAAGASLEAHGRPTDVTSSERTSSPSNAPAAVPAGLDASGAALRRVSACRSPTARSSSRSSAGRFFAVDAKTGKRVDEELPPLRSRLADRLEGRRLPGADAPSSRARSTSRARPAC